MTFPAPCSPWSVRQRLRARNARRQAVRAVARLLAALAARLDPPAEHLARARVLRDASRPAHPSSLPVAPWPPALQLVPEPEWVPCNLGVLTATRPMGSPVRLTHPQTGCKHEGALSALVPSDLSTVRYVLAIEEPDGRTVLDLPLSHPLEVYR